MKTNRFTLMVVSFVLLASMACGILQIKLPAVTGLSAGGGAVGYQYWKGAMPNSYNVLNIYGDPAIQVTGIPFMVLTYDKVTLEVTDLEFGFSEVTQKAIPNPNDFPGMAEPTVDANAIDFYKKLGLKSSVILIVSWNVQVPGGVSKSIINGVQQFSFLHPVNGIGPNKNKEKWIFAYTSSDMMGGVTNLDTYGFSGRQSKTNAIKLYQQ
jgi:hypothetical protein